MKVIIIGLILIALLSINFFFFRLFSEKPEGNWLVHPGNVRGSAIEHKSLIYTLNFGQQKLLLDFLNESKVIEQKVEMPQTNQTNTIQKIIIYLFDDTEIFFFPEGDVEIKKLFVKKGKVFSIELDRVSGFNELMNSTY